MDSAEINLSIRGVLLKIVLIHVALNRELLGHWSQHFHEQSQVVIIFFMVVPRSWIEEKVTSQKLEGHAGKTPQVSGGIIVNAHDDFRSSILPGLNLRHKMIMSPTAIAQIANLAIDVLVDKRPSDIDSLLFAQLDGNRILVPVRTVFLIELLGSNLTIKKSLFSLVEFSL